MAEDKLVVTIDNFFTATRMVKCFAESCINNVNRECRFRELRVSDDGRCKSYWVRKPKDVK